MNTNISPVAVDLIEAIERYKEESSKTTYRFELEEQLRLQKEIAILEKHIELLADYETKKDKK